MSPETFLLFEDAIFQLGLLFLIAIQQILFLESTVFNFIIFFVLIPLISYNQGTF